MATPEFSARLRYLNESSHLLALTAPETSRHLMTVIDSLLLENDLEPPESRRREVCGACGTIMIVSSGAKVAVEPKQPLPSRRKRKGKASDDRPARRQEKVLVYTCGACGRYTRHDLGAPPTANRKIRPDSKQEEIAKQDAGTQSSKTAPAVDKVATAKSASRKRAKSRKKNVGLEAILARQKVANSMTSGLGLSLMDFMKKP